MIQFDKKISIDGIAVIIATIGLVVWLSNLKSTQDNHTTELADHSTQIQKISETQNLMQQNLAVLTALQSAPKRAP